MVTMDHSVTETKDEVVDKLKYIEETKETMDKNTKRLAELVQDIGGIHTGRIITEGNIMSSSQKSKLFNLLHPFPDRTPHRLEFTQKVAEDTLNHSAVVLETITPISAKVEQWAANMRNNEYSTHAYEQAVVSAGDTGTAVRSKHHHHFC